jgi:hypothetical protein
MWHEIMAAVPECDDEDEWQSLIFSASVDTDIWLYSGQVRRSLGLWTSSRTESSVQCRWKSVMTSHHRFTAHSDSNQSISHQKAPFNMRIYGRTCAKIHLFSSVSLSCPGGMEGSSREWRESAFRESHSWQAYANPVACIRNSKIVTQSRRAQTVETSLSPEIIKRKGFDDVPQSQAGKMRGF